MLLGLAFLRFAAALLAVGTLFLRFFLALGFFVPTLDCHVVDDGVDVAILQVALLEQAMQRVRLLRGHARPQQVGA